MRKIERSTRFKKDFKRELKGKYQKIVVSELKKVVISLTKDEMLASRYRDHDLSGSWVDYRECHIKPELLLIYRKLGSDILMLARLGSHSALFN